MILNLYGTICNLGQEAKDGFYQFSVTDVSQIDLNRIVREQYESGNLVTLLTDGNEPTGLLVHKEFLAKFVAEDNINVVGYRLSPTTGQDLLTPQYKGRSYYIMTDTKAHPLEGARFLCVSQAELRDLPAQLAAARAFTRKITVKVHTL